MKIPSKYLEFAVEQLSSLPGIGKRTALRMALNLLNRENDQIVDFSSSILDLKNKTTKCVKCGNISDTEICSICIETYRENDLIFTLKCGHTYHKECISKWYDKKATCPYCVQNSLEV